MATNAVRYSLSYVMHLWKLILKQHVWLDSETRLLKTVENLQPRLSYVGKSLKGQNCLKAFNTSTQLLGWLPDWLTAWLAA